MANKDVSKYDGPAAIDISALAPQLLDIKDGERRGYKREKPSFDKVEAELSVSMPAVGDEAGIHSSVYQGFKDKTGLIAQIRAAKLQVAKLAQILEESECFYEDAREGDIIRICEAVEISAKQTNKPELLARFDATLKYRGQYAEKAAASRKKNEPGAGGEGGNEPPK
jgi:hypothetical protein